MEFKEEFDHNAAFRTMRALCERYSSRVSGSSQELEAMRYLTQHFRKKVGYYPVVDQYPIKNFKGHYASIQILPDGDIIEGKPMWMTINTPSNGLEGELSLIEINDENPLQQEDITNKIVLISSTKDYLEPQIFIQIKNIFKLNPSGVIILSSFHPEVIRSDIFYKPYSIFSEIPTMIIPKSKFPLEKITSKNGKLIVFGELETGSMFNVSIIVPGKEKEFILIYANHDTTDNSQGARSNAAGIAILLELAKIISRYNLRYSYRLISLGGKERGLEGMRKLLEDYDPSKVILGINIDSINSTPGQIETIITGEKHLFDLLETINLTLPSPAKISLNSTFGGDNMALSEKNIPSILLTLERDEVGKIKNTELDTIDNYKPDSLKLVGEYTLKIISKLEQKNPDFFSKKIPDDFKEITEKYFENLRLYQE
jgi:aminopeptidase YwaD